MHVVTLTSLFPNAVQPHLATFVRARMEHFAKRHGAEWTVVAPVPWFPKALARLGIGGHRRIPASVPDKEDGRGYPVYHPRYLVTPKVGMRYYGSWMAAAVMGTLREIHREKPIDVIDGHFIYPDGTATVAAGKALGVPAVLSARGTDLVLYSGLPHIAPLLSRNLLAADRVICVSTDLKRIAVELGLPDGKATVIGNGVDGKAFRPQDKAECRRRLGLRGEGRMFLCVGRLTELKGFSLVAEAMSRLPKDAFLAVVGEGEERERLLSIVAKHGLQDRVILPGPVAHKDLPAWYGAADFYVLASSREGWPNVLCEAQACGLPIVSTPLPGTAEIVTDAGLGLTVASRDVTSIAGGMSKALETDWDRDRIAAVGRARTWDQVADRVMEVFQAAIAGRRGNS